MNGEVDSFSATTTFLLQANFSHIHERSTFLHVAAALWLLAMGA